MKCEDSEQVKTDQTSICEEIDMEPDLYYVTEKADRELVDDEIFKQVQYKDDSDELFL